MSVVFVVTRYKCSGIEPDQNCADSYEKSIEVLDELQDPQNTLI